MRKIGIVVNSNKPGATELLPKLRDWLVKRENSVSDTTSSALDELVRESDLLISLGGDGTLLSISKHIKEKSVPVLGVNLGRLGFLTEIKQDEVFEELNSFFIGSSKIEERLMLSCTASSAKTKKERRLIALNDIVISREGLSRMLRVEIFVSKEKLTSFAGDGVIVATPTGSTAYSLSAGGAVLHPQLETIIITPICPHASSLRPIVVAASEKITVRIQSSGGANKGLLTADGQENLEIDDSYTVEITRAVTPLRLVKSSKRSYFDSLRENFKFPS